MFTCLSLSTTSAFITSEGSGVSGKDPSTGVCSDGAIAGEY